MFFRYWTIFCLPVLIAEKPDIVEISPNNTKTLKLQLNASNEFVLIYEGLDELNTTNPFRIKTSIESHTDFPVMVSTEQEKSVASWSIPLMIETESGDFKFFNNVSKIMCINPKEHEDQSNSSVLPQNFIISLSTFSTELITVDVELEEQKEFYAILDKKYSLVVSPSESKYVFFSFDNHTSDTVIIQIESTDEVCFTVSVQNSKCPVFDMNIDIKYNGLYQTLNLKGSITISKSDYPDGFFLIFVAKPDNLGCSQKSSHLPTLEALPTSNLTTNIIFSIKNSISYQQYFIAIGGTTGVLALVGSILVILALVSHRYGSISKFNKNDDTNAVTDGINVSAGTNMDQSSSSNAHTNQDGTYMEESSSSATHNAHTSQDGTYMDESTSSATVNAQKGEIFLPDDTNTTQNLLLQPHNAETTSYERADNDPLLESVQAVISDFAKDPERINKKSFNYLSQTLNVALFYSIPVVQLVVSLQRTANLTGDQDMCYYNFMCAHPAVGASDFNHIFSNIGYIIFGIIFIIIVIDRHIRMRIPKHKGIPVHYGILYAFGVALIIEGILSSCYHVCPSQSNFQFDTSFMYVMAVLCMVKLYQNRHADVNTSAYTAFAILGVAIFMAMLGTLYGSLLIWIPFAISYTIFCIYTSFKIYFMNNVIEGIKTLHNNIKEQGLCVDAFVPIRKGRFILLTIANIANLSMVIVGLCLYHKQIFASYQLYILIGNTLIHTFFYTTMKWIHKERLCIEAKVCGILGFVLFAGSVVFFFDVATIWKVPPAESRHWNQECILLDFYDNHDVWHLMSAPALFLIFMFLMTIDDDIINKNRNEIPVF